VSCLKEDNKAKLFYRETNTMPSWAGSSWYYLRYIDNKNDVALVDKEKEKIWSPVDFYVGGAEHATRHLIYARFWHKFLFDLGLVNYEEPFIRLQNVGLIQAEDGRKMSKRYGNVVNPNDVIAEYGADTFRLYEMFIGPFDQPASWNTKNIAGVERFVDRVYALFDKVYDANLDNDKVLLNQTIKKVGEDIEDFKFNTAISQMMILLNDFEKYDKVSKEDFEKFILILSPFAPFITEELWNKLGNKESVYLASWPKYDESNLINKNVTFAIQINGKLRGTVEMSLDATKEEVLERVKTEDFYIRNIDGKEIKNVIFVKNKLLNILI